jgi:hypothetical protein
MSRETMSEAVRRPASGPLRAAPIAVPIAALHAARAGPERPAHAPRTAPDRAVRAGNGLTLAESDPYPRPQAHHIRA